MEHNQIIKSLNFIRPDSKWLLQGETLVWQDDKQVEPTLSDIKQGYNAAIEKEEQDKKDAIAKKAAAEEKLIKLGLTVEDIKALGLA